VTGALGVATDVTEQRRIEEEVRAARARERLLADLAIALTREGLDPQALLAVAVRAVTESVAEAGLVWLRTPDGRAFEPRVLFRRGEPAGPRVVDGVEAAERLDPAAVEAWERPQVLASGSGGTAGAGVDLLARLALPARATEGLRVPLRSRGVLLGVVDIARRPELGPFGEADLDLVAEIGERCALSLDNALLFDAHRTAREQLLKFEALAQASDNLIGITDTQDHIIYSNPRVAAYGIQLTGADVWATADEYLEPGTTTVIKEGLARDGRWVEDIRLLIAGTEICGRLAAFRLTHPDTGADLGTGWIAQDTTNLRRTEAALRTANADMKQFKALVEASPDFIAIAGLDGQVRYLNPGGRALIGMDPGVDVTTTTIADYLTPEGLEASVSVEQPAVIAQGHWEGESTLRNFRGPEIPVAISSFLMHDAETGAPFALATVQRDITQHRTAEARLRDLAEQRQTLLARLVEAQDEERARIAADVHDDPVQVLSAVDVRLGMLRRRLGDRAPDLLELLDPLQHSVSDATARLRALLFDLEPPALRHGLSGALERAADEIFAGTGTSCTIHGEREPEVPDAIKSVAYLIAKEAMHNARKHAAAHHVSVTVDGSEDSFEVSIADDGVGLGPGPVESSPGHRGLLNMQDRAAVAGGRCSIRSRAGGGTVVSLSLPVEARLVS
jgi:PAS domain S-box-containing protein